ncbi:hypothetical protein ABQ485_25475, partial [Citrobacter portucalensis]|uniref:hypothetical protein n=1 Tax=Citrobacter portucalensis TaxID=1639133 RepID=UPI003AB01621
SYAPVRARLVTEPYRRIRKTSGYAGGYLFRKKTVFQAPFAERINYMSVIMDWANVFTFK